MTKSWKKAVPDKHYRLIEAILYSYADMKHEIREWRESVLLSSRKPDDGQPRGHARVSDPTAIATLRMMEPPQHISEAIRWVEVVDMVLRQLKTMDADQPDSHLYDICRTYYHLDSMTSRYGRRSNYAIKQDLAEKHHVVVKTIETSKDLIVSTAYMAAIYKGLISPFEEIEAE